MRSKTWSHAGELVWNMCFTPTSDVFGPCTRFRTGVGEALMARAFRIARRPRDASAVDIRYAVLPKTVAYC